MTKSKVIVVSGVTAGGKTTFIQELSHNLDNNYILSFDDYSIDALPTVPPLDSFLENAKEALNKYDISLLMNDLLVIKDRYDIILIDFPFGYEHETLSPHIDTVIYLKTPLDVAFARQLIRDYSDKDKEAILNWSRAYLDDVRPIFLEHEKLIASTADYVLDGSVDVKEQIKEIKKKLTNR